MFSGSIVALVTPMNTDGSVDTACLRRLVNFHIEHGTKGLVINGTTGESATLTTDEKFHHVKVALEEAAGRCLIIAGTGTQATQSTLEQTLAAAELGVDACLVVTPYYNRPTQHGLFQHFSKVAKNVSVPLILYNVPKRTGCDLLPETMIALARECDTILGLKEAADWTRIRTLRAGLPLHCALLSGDDPSAFEFMREGGHGVISVTSNIVPDLMASFCQYLIEGMHAQAEEAHQKMLPLHQVLGVESNPIPLKWLMAEVGLIPQGIRLPLTPLAKQHHQQVMTTYDRCLNEFGLSRPSILSA